MTPLIAIERPTALNPSQHAWAAFLLSRLGLEEPVSMLGSAPEPLTHLRDVAVRSGLRADIADLSRFSAAHVARLLANGTIIVALRTLLGSAPPVFENATFVVARGVRVGERDEVLVCLECERRGSGLIGLPVEQFVSTLREPCRGLVVGP